MVSFSHIARLLKDSLAPYPGTGGSPARIGLVQFLPEEGPLRDGCAYLCTARELTRRIERSALPHGSVAIIPERDAADIAPELLMRTCIYISRAEPRELLSGISRILYENSLLAEELLSVLRGGTDELVAFAALRSGSVTLALGPDGALVAASERGGLARSDIHATPALLACAAEQARLGPRRGFFIRRLPDSGGTSAMFMQLQSMGESAGTLVFIDPHSGSVDCETLMELVAGPLAERISYEKSPQLARTSFKSYLIDMFGGTIGTAADNLRRLNALPLPVDEFMRPALIDLSESAAPVPFDYIRSQVCALYRGANLAVIGSRVYFMPCYPSYTDGDMHAEELSALVGPYNGYVCFSDGTHTPGDLHVCFRLAERAVSLAKKLRFHQDPPRHVFTVSEWRHYIIIDMCARFFSRELENADLMYLVDRRVSKLAFYDRQHGTDLGHTLFTYLACNHSLTDTAEILHIHKNTVGYKLGRIRQLVGEIPYGAKQFNWISSYHFLEYLRDYKNDITYTPYDYHTPSDTAASAAP